MWPFTKKRKARRKVRIPSMPALTPLPFESETTQAINGALRTLDDHDSNIRALSDKTAKVKKLDKEGE